MACFKLVTLFIVIFVINNVSSAKILGIFHIPSKSHHILGSKLLRALAEKGHEVTMVSPYPFKDKIKNYRDISLDEMLRHKQENFGTIMKHNATFWERFKFFQYNFQNVTETVLQNKEVQKLKNEKFDVIIQIAFFTESFLGLAHHIGAPVILLSTFGSTSTIDKITGNPSPPSFVPSITHPTSAEMTFFERLRNSLSTWYSYCISSPMQEMQQQELLSKYFPNAPSVQELLNNVSLILLNSHYSIETPRPYVPNMIPIGGFHVEEPKQLPQDLKKFLDEAIDGAIFFSLGSNVKISRLPADKVQAIINIFGKLKMRVLFKSDEEIPNLPKNIKVGKWLPQNDILAHPNLKLFVSHGGMLSTIEAVYHGVPIIGIPLFGDQKLNVAVAVVDGYAIKVDLDELNEEMFMDTINEVLNNPKYRNNIQLRSSLIRDQPIKPLDNAIFWIEHVIKYKGAAHLKNAGNKLYLYQYFLLDVIAFVAAVCLAVFTVLYLGFRKFTKFVKHAVLGRPKPKKE